jgi:paired amphipathic helix protein Sin3a
VTCSGRDEMCRSVLNDEWVSHPTWSSEDSGFVAHKKNAFEEALHRSEEERHEYDFHLDAIQRTIGMLEPINAKIAALAGQEDRAGFKLKPNLGGAGKTVHQRVIKKVYGREAGLDILQLMQDLPVDTIPVVLMRLKQKEEEWKRAQREWNKVWREVDARNYPKSLDHLGITFKAADKKALTAKAFLNQIEAVRDEQMAARASLIDPTFARTRKRHHLEFLVDDKAVLQDGLKLTFGFLDRAQPQITFAERKRIEGFLRSFVPSFFGWDPVSFNASFVVLQGVGKENAESDGGASDDVSGNANVTVDDVEVASVASTSSRRSHKKGAAAAAAAAAAAGSGDLRKNLLKSEQAKSAGRKARTGDGLSPAVSRMASPALTEVDSAVDESAAAAGDSGQWKRPSRRNLFFCNGVFYTLVRLLEVSVVHACVCRMVSDDVLVCVTPGALLPPGPF